jgi:serine protease Do
MKIHKKYSSGRVSPAVVLAAVIILGLTLVIGWWYGGQQRRESLPKPSPKKQRPLKNRDHRTAPSIEKSLILEDRISDVAESAMPAVVNVFTEKVIQTRGRSPFFDDPFFRFFFGPGRNLPRERRERSLGSGVIVSDDGYVLTNNHVVENADEIRIALFDKREFEASIVGTDPQTDLAVLKIDADGLSVLEPGDSDQLRVGQVVLAIGNPFGLSGSVSMGIVSALGRSRVLDPRDVNYQDFIQTDAAINPGNSGGALINLAGELIGVNTAIFSRSGGYQGIGFAIPSNLARHVMESLISSGEVKRGWLGVGIQNLNPELSEQFGLSGPGGVLIAEVFENTPADKAGVEAGDVIVAVAGERIEDTIGLRNTIAEYPPGSEVEVEVVRDGDKKAFEVTLGEKPSQQKMGRWGERLPQSSGRVKAAGMTVDQLTPKLADQLGIESDRPGVVVVDVESGGRAEMAGVMVGDIIFRVNRRQIRGLEDFQDAVRRAKSKALLLHLRRQGSSMFIVVPK